MSRPSQREADAYVRSVAVTHRDDGAIDTMLTLSLRPASQRAMTRAEAAYVRARSGASSHRLLAGKHPDTVAGAPTPRAEAGFAGAAAAVWPRMTSCRMSSRKSSPAVSAWACGRRRESGW